MYPLVVLSIAYSADFCNKKALADGKCFFIGATDPIRTDDLLITSELLYLLSHSSMFPWNRPSIPSFSPAVKREFADFFASSCQSAEFLTKISAFTLDKGKMCVIITSVGFGRVPEWPKGTDCKSAAFSFGGSNPPSPTKYKSIAYGGAFIFGGTKCALRHDKRSLRSREDGFA